MQSSVLAYSSVHFFSIIVFMFSLWGEWNLLICNALASTLFNPYFLWVTHIWDFLIAITVKCSWSKSIAMQDCYCYFNILLLYWHNIIIGRSKQNCFSDVTPLQLLWALLTLLNCFIDYCCIVFFGCLHQFISCALQTMREFLCAQL
jgi:hypothetical protein